MVRDTLGEDAVIVSTGEEALGGVRVVAAIEPAFELETTSQHDGGWLQYDSEQDTDAVAEAITDALLRHAVPEDVTDYIVSCVTVMGFEEVGIGLVETLGQLFKFRPLPTQATQKPIMMVGSPGSGKTLAVAKMAARGVMNGLSIGVISTDTVRAGGVEQLKAFTDLMGASLYKVSSPQDMQHIVHDLLSDGTDQILIDTYGLNPFNTEDIRTLARLIGAAQATPVMVLPGGVDADEAGEMARVFATLGATQILPTRVDIARRLGGILAAAHQGSLCFADVSNTPKIAQGLETLTPQLLARLILPSAFRKGQSSATESPRKVTPRSNENKPQGAHALHKIQKTGIRQ